MGYSLWGCGRIGHDLATKHSKDCLAGGAQTGGSILQAFLSLGVDCLFSAWFQSPWLHPSPCPCLVRVWAPA